MTREDFKEALQKLRDFEKERDKLDAVINAISPTLTTSVDFGGYFIDSYLKVLEIALNCPLGWVSSFVFECEYGLYPFTGEVNGRDFSVKTEDEFYDLVQEAYKLDVFWGIKIEAPCWGADLDVLCGGTDLDYCVHLSGDTSGIEINTNTDKFTIK